MIISENHGFVKPANPNDPGDEKIVLDQHPQPPELPNSLIADNILYQQRATAEVAVKPLLIKDIRFRPVERIYGTIFVSRAAREQLRLEWDNLDHLAEEIRRASAPGKESLPWLKLARFGDTFNPDSKSPYPSLRYDANVEWFDGIECDIDGVSGTMPMAEAAKRLAGVRCLLYTTASSTPAAPHYRVLCPLSGLYTGPAEALTAVRSRLVARVNGALGGILAHESFTLSQSFYFGNAAGKPPIEVVVTPGKSPIDWLHPMDAAARFQNGSSEPPKPRERQPAPDGLVAVDLSDAPPELIEAAKQTVLRHGGIRKYSLACKLIELRHRGRVLSEDAVVDFLLWHDPGCTDEHAREKVDHAIRYLKNARGAETATIGERFGQ